MIGHLILQSWRKNLKGKKKTQLKMANNFKIEVPIKITGDKGGKKVGEGIAEQIKKSIGLDFSKTLLTNKDIHNIIK